jgi:hypothetical protein
MIGIFWIINDFLLAKRIELSKVEEIKGFKDSDFSHFFEWEKMGFDIDRYDKSPRGRIVYNTDNKKFIVYAAKKIISNEKYKKMIIDFFKIKNYEFKYDEHYQIKSLI